MEEIGKESIQEEPVSEETTVKTSSSGVDSITLSSGVATHNESSGRDILAKDSQVVEQDDKLNESKTRITPCKMIKIQEGWNLMDKKEGIYIVLPGYCFFLVSFPSYIYEFNACLCTNSIKQFYTIIYSQVTI